MSFECIECGHVSMKWIGRCPSCSQWDTFEESVSPEEEESPSDELLNAGSGKLSSLKASDVERMKTGMPGMDRILGGGAVPGEVVLLGGPPGVGKSTLFLQLAGKISDSGRQVLYVSGEESPAQIKIHSERLKISGENITVLGSGNLQELTDLTGKLRPAAVFVDSIQAVADPACGGAPGTVKQVKKSGQIVTALAKNTGAVVFVSGQITKQGDIAGPKLLEHMVDAVIYMEPGEGDYRVLSAEKNRFGSCGDFLMLSLEKTGLKETEHPGNFSGIGNSAAPGRAFCCVRAGRRLTAAEIQTLSSPSYFEYPLRRTSGFSRERLLMLSAIASKYLGLKMAGTDIYLNVSGVTRLQERSSDLAALAALYSGVTGIPVPGSIIFAGEVGLSGEVRPLRDAGERLAFASRNGFKKVVLSGGGSKVAEKSGSDCVYISELGQIRNIIRVAAEGPK